MHLNEFWTKIAAVSPEEFELYMNPKNLPHEFGKGHAKKVARDVVLYRLKNLDQVFSCILTTYGRPTALSSLLIRRGGIYGSLFQEGPIVRKLVPAEICILMGLINMQYLPNDWSEALLVLGNAIAVPHALIALLNCLNCIRDQWTLGRAQEIFADIMSQAIKAPDVCIRFDNEGYFVTKGETGGSQVPATVPIRQFARVTVKSPLLSFSIIVQTGLCIRQVLQMVTGESFPLHLEVMVHSNETVRFPLPHDMRVTDQDMNIAANVPSCLILSEAVASANDWPFIAVLHKHDILIIGRSNGMTGSDMHAAIMQAGRNLDDGPVVDFIGKHVPDNASPPNVVFVTIQSRVIDLWELVARPIVFRPMAEAFVTSCMVRDIHGFIHWLDRIGVHAIVRSLGWHFLVQLDVDSDDTPKDVILTSKSGRLSIQPNAICQLLMTKIFINQVKLIEERHRGDSPVQVSLKLWNTWVWSAPVDGSNTTDFIHEAWRVAHELFDEHVPIVLIAHGQRINRDFPIDQYAKIDDDGLKYLKMHLVIQLKGGGPSTPVSLQPAERSETSARPDAIDLRDLVLMNEHDPGRLLDLLVKELLETPESEQYLDADYLNSVAMRDEGPMLSLTGSVPTIVRFMRDLHATGIEEILQTLGWQTVMHIESSQDPAIVKMMIMPRIDMRCITKEVIVDFLISAVTMRTMPLPAFVPQGPQVRVRVKLWETWILDGMYPPDMPTKVFADPWAKAAALLAETSQMRMIGNGKRLNPDFPISEYVHNDEYGHPYLKVYLVLQLHGGGVAKQSNPTMIKQKNELARMLLESGGSLEEITVFTDQIINAAGVPAVSACMKTKDNPTRMSNLQKLAKTLNISMPAVKAGVADSKRPVQKKLEQNQFKQKDIRAEDFRPQTGFFRNEDGTPCPIISVIQHGVSGVAIANPEDALPWIRAPMKISQDELAILVLGECPSPSTCCNKIQIPAVASDDKPVILAVCMHQLGNKSVECKAPEDTNVQVGKTSVMALTIFQDEIEPEIWQQVVKSPVKTVFELLKAQGMELRPTTSPWGRSWRAEAAKAQPENATSLQFYARLPDSQVKECLRISGQKGVYTVLKTEDRRTDLTYAVVWLDLPLRELRVSSASLKASMGLVRITKGTKSSRGIRFHTDDYDESYKALKPSAIPTTHVTVKAVAKLSPTPVGANFDTVKEWLEMKQWKAKPLKSLGPQTWLIGFEHKVPDQWVSWGWTVDAYHMGRTKGQQACPSSHSW